MMLLDANIIVRYLTEDNIEMADKAEEYIKSGEAYVTTEVIAEAVYVLCKIYSIGRKEISYQITEVMNFVNTDNVETINLALRVYEKTNLDFVDCVLFAYHKLFGFEIATFDKQLIKLMSRSDSGEEF